jgi:hypothetical protein
VALKRTASYSRRLTPAASLQPGFPRFVWLQIGKIRAIFRRSSDIGVQAGASDVIFGAAQEALTVPCSPS